MRTEGTLTPQSWGEARDRYQALGSTATIVVRAVAKAMDFDQEEYESRITQDVITAARHALFAAELAVHVDDRDGFEAWRSDYPHPVHVVGSDNVTRVAWHVAPVADTAVAATFQNEPEAAVATTRRLSFNRIYRDEL